MNNLTNNTYKKFTIKFELKIFPRGPRVVF